MCGIFGYIGYIPEKKARLCTDALKHRGPDDGALWHRSDVTLGHRRLSILDLSEKGRQPMPYFGDRYWIVHNGEIYNFLELRRELEGKGYKFTSETDTEVILASFIAWGEACLERFNGMWAFAIWDDKEKRLFLSRDRFGKKPLFYVVFNNTFAFASEMKALFPTLSALEPNVPLIRNLKNMFLYENTEECLIEGIKRFPAGHFGWYGDGKFSTHPWWCTLDHLVDVPNHYEDQVEKFQELFLDACKIRMRSDVPLGTALSGGLDSSSAISVMAHIARNEPEARTNLDWQHAFVACFPNTPLDESKYAKMVTDHLAIEATFIDISPLKILDRIFEYLYLFEELYITPPIPFFLTYRAMRNHGIKVTVDGHGADECFGGYEFEYITALKDAKFKLSQIRMILDTRYNANPQNSSQFKLPSKFRFWAAWHLKDAARNLLPRKTHFSENKRHPEWKRLDHLTQQLYISTHQTILPTILRNYDRYSMSNGVEIRMPFMDHRIVTYAFSLPWTSKIRKGFSKSIIRDAVAPYLPAPIAYRKAKIGFNSPIVDWMKGPLKDFFLDTLNSKTFNHCDLIDPEKVSKKITRVINDANATFLEGQEAWTMLTPYLWELALLKRSEPYRG